MLADILIYDEHRDRLAHVTFEEAVAHAMPWDDEGGVFQGMQAGSMGPDPFRTVENGPRIKALVDASVNALGVAIDTTTLLACTTDGTACLKKAWWTNAVEMAKMGVWVPCMLVISRPFIEHNMLSAIIAVKGADTGNTLFGPADMQISANTAVKVIEGHYTCHTKSVITKPQNVMVMRDIQCDGYVTGGDVTWFGDFSKEPTQTVTKEDVKTDLRDRLEFAHEYDNQYGSMFAFAAPYTDNPQFLQDQAFSLADQMLPWEVGDRQSSSMNGGVAEPQRNFPGGSNFYNAYKKAFGFYAITQGVDTASMQRNDFIRNGTYNNTFVILGPHRTYSPFTKSHFDLTPGQGHFGPDALPGDARWRRGEAIDAPSARNALVGVEALVESKQAMHRLN